MGQDIWQKFSSHILLCDQQQHIQNLKIQWNHIFVMKLDVHTIRSNFVWSFADTEMAKFRSHIVLLYNESSISKASNIKGSTLKAETAHHHQYKSYGCFVIWWININVITMINTPGPVLSPSWPLYKQSGLTLMEVSQYAHLSYQAFSIPLTYHHVSMIFIDVEYNSVWVCIWVYDARWKIHLHDQSQHCSVCVN